LRIARKGNYRPNAILILNIVRSVLANPKRTTAAFVGEAIRGWKAVAGIPRASRATLLRSEE
jgi:hypothetical protein